MGTYVRNVKLALFGQAHRIIAEVKSMMSPYSSS